MDLDIRAEMEAAAAELEAQGADFEADDETDEPAASSDPKAEAEGKKGDTEQKEQVEPKPDAKPDEKATDDVAIKEGEKKKEAEALELPKGSHIPRARVEVILKNAREKARAEAIAELQPKLDALAWAAEYSEAEVKESMEIVDFADKHPLHFYRRLRARLIQDGMIEGDSEPEAKPKEKDEPKDDKPQPDILLQDGRLTYSSEQMEKLLEWKERQLNARLDERIKPVEEERVKRDVDSRAERKAAEIYAAARKWDGFVENQVEIAETMGRQKVGIEEAYRLVVIPKLKAEKEQAATKTRAEVLAELKAKPNRATNRPRADSGVGDYKGKSVREILEATASELGTFDSDTDDYEY